MYYPTEHDGMLTEFPLQFDTFSVSDTQLCGFKNTTSANRYYGQRFTPFIILSYSFFPDSHRLGRYRLLP